MCKVLTAKRGGQQQAQHDRQRRTELVDQVPVVLQECAVSTALRDLLRTAEVDVHSIAERRYGLGGREQLVGVVRAELMPHP